MTRNSARWTVRVYRFLTLLLLLPVSAAAQAPAVQPQYQPQLSDVQEVMIPMRDGVHLQTVIIRPKQASEPLPFILRRTPYGVPKSADNVPASYRYDQPLWADGYIFVSQNIRGRFKSEGTFVMQRPPRDKSDPKSIDEGTDAYDTIDWLIKSVPNNNGRVGMTGTSYPGWLVTQALLEPHPALKAVSEQASPDDMFINDDFHHNGAFRLSYGFEYAALLETSKEKNTNFEFDQRPQRQIPRVGVVLRTQLAGVESAELHAADCQPQHSSYSSAKHDSLHRSGLLLSQD